MKYLPLFSLGMLCLANAENWAVIVAGSNEYYNYRHQADVCHAFKICHDNGIDKDRIITMHFDDIAKDRSNPYPGKVFNKPTEKGTPGVDVYAGCQKDYVGMDVTADYFIKVITGDSKGVKGKKVLNSTAEDNVFIYFTDHGTGLIAFPTGPYLQAKTLIQALKLMHQKKMYSKLVFYMEACESGSMFQGLLPPNMNIYAMTAANAEESSWGCYCPPEDSIDGVEIGSCLGDLFSVNWMENSDQQGMNQTLQNQFVQVRDKTDMSHVTQFGDLSFTNLTIGNFQGDHTMEAIAEALTSQHDHTKTAAASRSLVDSRDIAMHVAYYAYLRADKADLAATHAKAQVLLKEIHSRLSADNMFATLAAAYDVPLHARAPSPLPLSLPIFDCFDAVNAAVLEHCGGYSDYSMRYARVVMNVCDKPSQTDKFVSRVTNLCLSDELI